MLKQITEVANFDNQTAEQFFIKSFIKYLHLGAKFRPEPILVDLSDILQIDEDDTNEGRENYHTNLETQRIGNDLANGVKPWLDLPIIVKNTDTDSAKKYKTVAGYGTLNGLKSNGVTKYWFYEVIEHTPSILSEIASFENTSSIVETKYNTGVDGIIYHIKNMIARKHKELINDEESISNYIDRTWPGMIPEVKGTIISKARNAQTKSRRIKTYNIPEVDNWLEERADKTAKFVHGGKFDEDRGMYGFVGVNIQDPFIRAAKKWNETGKQSYVVLHCKNPGKTQTIPGMRKTLLKNLEEFKKTFSDLGMKTDFLVVLGFLPQDKEIDKMTLLV